MYLRFFKGLPVSFFMPFKKAAKLAPFSGDSPLPNVLVTTNKSFSLTSRLCSYSSMHKTCQDIVGVSGRSVRLRSIARNPFPSPLKIDFSQNRNLTHAHNNVDNVVLLRLFVVLLRLFRDCAHV